jgi:DNA-binding MarR family transcriptional regulator
MVVTARRERRQRSLAVATTRRTASATVRRRPGKALKSMAVLQQFRELFRVSQQHFQRVEATCGLSGAQLWAMSELKAAPGLTISALARALSVHLSTASNLVDRLETKALVRRERNKSDQRVVRVFVTSKGQQVLQRAPRPAAGIIPDALERMPLSVLTSLNRDLARLLELTSLRDRRARMKPLADL